MTMKKLAKTLILTTTSLGAVFCTKPATQETVDTQPPVRFEEAVPDTICFSEATFLYNGDYVGDNISDGWIIKLYSEESMMQILINSRRNEDQSPDLTYISGRYKEMTNSGNYAPGTFVSGRVTYIDLPGGEVVEVPDPTFFASLTEDKTDLYYDYIDEGVLQITHNGDDTYSIEGIMVGKMYTKRYIRWTGHAEAETTIPEVTPNSTLKADLTDISFTRGQLQDKGDYFYLKDESYRCLLLFLVNEGADLQYNRPGGTSPVLRLEFLVPWETDYESGIPEDTYTMVPRNPDTSMDRDMIIPGGAVAGLPNVFEAWKMAGSWYYELVDGTWTETYARIDDGTISVERGEDGSHQITYDLTDCQNPAKRITGVTELDEIDIY